MINGRQQKRSGAEAHHEIKSGWLWERKGGAASMIPMILAKANKKLWSPRWVVLYDGYDGEDMSIGVYEQKSDAQPPCAPLKHYKLPASTTQAWSGSGRRKTASQSPGDWIKNKFSTASMASINSNNDEDSHSALTDSIANLAIENGPVTIKEKKGTIFQIQMSSSSRLTFATGSTAERDSWLIALKTCLCNRLESPLPSVPSTLSSPSSCNAVLPNSPLMQKIAESQETMRKESPKERKISIVNAVDGFQVNGFGIWTADQIAKIKQTNHLSLTPLETGEEDERLDELNLRYQTAIRNSTMTTGSERVRYQSEIRRLVGKFNNAVHRRMTVLVDNFHTNKPLSQQYPYGACEQKGPNRWEWGPLSLTLIANYSLDMGENEILEAGHAFLRQEMNACRWIQTINQSSTFPIHTPLMTVIDYKGFRALGMMKLPLEHNGSRLVDEHSSWIREPSDLYHFEEINSAILQLPSRLGLLPIPGREGWNSSLPEGLEVYHFTQSAQTAKGLYLTNLQGLIPSWPSEGGDFIDCNGTNDLSQKGILFFRPEIFTEKIATLPPGEYGTAEKKERVLRMVKEDRITAFLSAVEGLEMNLNWGWIGQQTSLSLCQRGLLLDSEGWREEMHSYGLNMAMLGAIAARTNVSWVREGALIEMVSRCAKNILRERIRGAILHFKSVEAIKVDDEIDQLTLNLINDFLLGRSDHQEVIEVLKERFAYAKIDRATIDNLPKRNLLAALEFHCPFSLRPSSVKRISNGGNPLQLEDISGYKATLSDQGCGPYPSSLSSSVKERDSIIASLTLSLNCTISSSDQSLFWNNSGKRSQLARCLMEEAMDLPVQQSLDQLDLSKGICPRGHPLQSIITLHICRLILLNRGGGDGCAAAGRVELILSKSTKAIYETLTSKDPVSGLLTILGLSLEDLEGEDGFFGEHCQHPLGVLLRSQYANLIDKVKGVHHEHQTTAGLRRDALRISEKILGKRHIISLSLGWEQAFWCEDAMESISLYNNLLGTLGFSSNSTFVQLVLSKTGVSSIAALESSIDEEGLVEVELSLQKIALLHFQQSRKASHELGDTEDGLEILQRLRDIVELPLPFKLQQRTVGLLERLWKVQAEMAISSVDSSSSSGPSSTAEGPLLEEDPLEVLYDCLSKAVGTLTTQENRRLSLALDCLSLLFASKKKSFGTSNDEEANGGADNGSGGSGESGMDLLKLIKKITQITFRLASPSQKAIIAAITKRKYIDSGNVTKDSNFNILASSSTRSRQTTSAAQTTMVKQESNIKDFLVQMISGPTGPQEWVEAVLGKSQTKDGLVEAEDELGRLLDIVQLVPEL